jgi:bifunctional non-homologous end joining protein LigD
MPVRWTELQRLKRAETLFFSPAAALKRLKRLGDLFAPVLTLKQTLPKAFTAPRPTTPAANTPPGPLRSYRTKRDFAQTPEPLPSPTAKRKPTAPAQTPRSFVIQKHAASHLHYDLRLEMDGTLKSWAVPKGLPAELGVKRSAFAVEDHPMDYLRFEGTIPKGQYGGGTVMVWDIGTYELLSGDYAKGTLKLRLSGKKLKGDWHLFKIRSQDDKDLWLIAKSGEAATPIPARQADRSAITGRTLTQIARSPTK